MFRKNHHKTKVQQDGPNANFPKESFTASSEKRTGHKSEVVKRIADYDMQDKRAKLRSQKEKIQNGIKRVNELIALHRSNLPNGFKVKKSVMFALEYWELQHVGNEFYILFKDVSSRLSQQDADLLQNARDAVHTIIKGIQPPYGVDEFRPHVDSQIKELYRRLHELSDVLNAYASCQSSEQGISDSADSNAGQNSQENTTGKQNCDNNPAQTGSRARKPKLSKQEKKQKAEERDKAKDTRKWAHENDQSSPKNGQNLNKKKSPSNSNKKKNHSKKKRR